MMEYEVKKISEMGYLVFFAAGFSALLLSCTQEQKKIKQNADPCGTFTNPIKRGADPWVIKKDGYYYFCESRDGGIYVSKSTKLTEPQNEKLVWKQPESGWNRATLWAPELHYLNGKWYIYYTAGKSGPPFIYQRSGVLESVSEDPQGDYVDKGRLYTGDHVKDPSSNIWSIDLTPLEIGDSLYAIWSGWKENRKDDATPQHLYIARMRNPWTISSNRVRISSPVEPWETGGPLDINEGPEVLKHGDDILVIYSTRESWLRYYRLGELQLKSPDADPLVAGNWKKTGPVFQGTDEVYGTGHASFTTSPDGTEYWMAYHSKVDTTPGWNRVVNLQSFSWQEDGTPDFGKPIATGKPMKSPAGQCK